MKVWGILNPLASVLRATSVSEIQILPHQPLGYVQKVISVHLDQKCQLSAHLGNTARTLEKVRIKAILLEVYLEYSYCLDENLRKGSGEESFP